ncbi:hypothetical protein RG959_17770 [Domibacillus sp. 8LH]|uniref:hypothetical protein n=1 Tax=Domibacillus sp. 8LH TaxID=3073900 RepID=UPI00317D0261
MLLAMNMMLIAGYSIYFSFASRGKGKGAAAKCFPMLLGTTSSLTLGLVTALLMPDKLALSTIVSIVLSAGTAYLIGKNYGLNGLIEAQASSLMGAMMGAMLGVMLSSNEETMMVLAMDMIYLASLYGARVWQAKENQALLNPKLTPLLITMCVSFCLVAAAGFLQSASTEAPAEESSHDHMH